MKLCPKCNRNLNFSEFYKLKRGGISAYCKKCIIIESTQRITEQRRILKKQFIKSFGGSCQLCKYDKSISGLIFHHLNPGQKEYEVSSIKTTPKLQEFNKCILLCQNCHMEVHEGLHPDILKYSPKLTHQTIIRRERKKEYVEFMGGACKNCSYNKCNRALNFHHEFDKKIKIGSLTQLPKLEKIKDELKKCVLLCANCHSEEHT